MKNNWYSQPEIENALGISRRTFHRRFSGLSSSLTREQTSAGRGRPGKLYHFAADPELSAWHFAQLSRRSTMSGADTIAPDDLALARLRLQAVKQYESIATQLPRVEAVAAVCRHWRLKPMSETVEVTERLPGGHTRKCSKEVSLGEFSPGTLRRWVRSYNKDKNLLDLVPKRKDHAGRSRKDIPEELLNFVHAMSVSTARADVANAIRKARNEWPGDFPEVSEVTWLRRIRERDPERVFDTLGKNGIASFRAKHSPDIERDYSKLRYNQLWQIDDVQEDFYGHGNDPAKILRPYAYAIVRVSTRQWVAAVTSQAPIVQDQVRRILGFAFCSERGGLPEEMSFEGGTVACDDYLAGLLDDLDLPPGVDRRDLRLMLLGSMNWSFTWYRPGAEPPAGIARTFLGFLRKRLEQPDS